MVLCENVTKNYGKHKALDNLNLTIDTGKIVGVFGPNGAGKTTLIKCMMSLLHYDSGKILIDGMIPGAKSKEITAYLPDKEFLYNWMTIKQAINFFNESFNDFNINKANHFIDLLGLKFDQKVNACSKGMLEQLNMALILSRDAKLYIFDEPLAAVDPLTRDKLLKMILDNFNKNSSLIISTHLINDVESLFTDVAFINNGKVILQDSVMNLKNKYNKSIQDIFKEII